MNSIKRSGILLTFTLLLATGCATTGGDVFGDTGITTRVKTAIFNEPELKVMAIHVSTEDRVVTLSGSVKTRAERAKAIQVARNVEGVKSVKNDLTLEK
jgi:osmotically-inducible protein OsmY